MWLPARSSWLEALGPGLLQAPGLGCSCYTTWLEKTARRKVARGCPCLSTPCLKGAIHRLPLLSVHTRAGGKQTGRCPGTACRWWQRLASPFTELAWLAVLHRLGPGGHHGLGCVGCPASVPSASHAALDAACLCSLSNRRAGGKRAGRCAGTARTELASAAWACCLAHFGAGFFCWLAARKMVPAEGGLLPPDAAAAVPWSPLALASALDGNLGGRQALPGRVLAQGVALAASLPSTGRAGSTESVSWRGLLSRLGTLGAGAVGVAGRRAR